MFSKEELIAIEYCVNHVVQGTEQALKGDYTEGIKQIIRKDLKMHTELLEKVRKM